MAEPIIVEILCIGNELLRGDIQDTNTNWICRLVNSHGGSFQRTLTIRCNDESLMVPALSRVVALHPQVYIKSLAKALGGIPELDILFTTTGKEEGECRALVDEAVRELQLGLTALGINHWRKEREPKN